MSPKLRWTLLIAAIALYATLYPGPSCFPRPQRFSKAFSETRQVGIAVTLYANDHQGRLPGSLDELAPNYLSDNTLFRHVHLTTPRAVLAELAPESIILFRVETDKNSGSTRVIGLHPDNSTEYTLP